METINILGTSHAYELTPPSLNSSNPVLIFIHGWLLSRNYWRPLINQLSPQYQCLVYDLRGFGDSSTISTQNVSDVDNSPSSYSLLAYAKDLSIMLDKLNIHKAWLIGHSLGGSIAIWGADYEQEKIQGVICLNSGGGIYLKEEFDRFRLFGRQIITKRYSWLSYVPFLDWVFARVMVAQPLSRNWGKQRLIDFLKANEQAALGSLLDSTTEAEVHLLPQIVARLQQPVYFLAGLEDKVMETKYVHHLASFHELFNANRCNVKEIANCGHLSMVEQPDIVANQIFSILQAHQSQS